MEPSCILFGILFLGAGILFALGKIHTHIAAWKQMSEMEREAIDIIPLCRNIGGMIALCGLIFLLSGISSAVLEHAFVWLMILWLLAAGFDVYYIGRDGRYKK